MSRALPKSLNQADNLLETSPDWQALTEIPEFERLAMLWDNLETTGSNGDALYTASHGNAQSQIMPNARLDAKDIQCEGRPSSLGPLFSSYSRNLCESRLPRLDPNLIHDPSETLHLDCSNHNDSVLHAAAYDCGQESLMTPESEDEKTPSSLPTMNDVHTTVENSRTSFHESNEELLKARSLTTSSGTPAKPRKRSKPSTDMSKMLVEGDAEKRESSKKAHTLVERRYRMNLNEKFRQLRDRLPPPLPSPTNQTATDLNGEQCIGVEDVLPHQKLNKGSVLTMATEYLEHVEHQQQRVVEENKALKGYVTELEKLVSGENCWLRQR
ncbi:MAG: hypothetical protein M1825_004291 [Sarcosagium campestre]|nr:MAG: hypothetical protein M1825_004291 [Sarcosagium campestre]